MIAELKIYGNPSSEKETKSYKVYRLTPHTVGAIQDFLFNRFDKEELQKAGKEFNAITDEKYANHSTKEMEEEMVRLLRILFPEITIEEINMLDYGDGSGENGQFYEFIYAIHDYANKESNRSLKN